VALLTMLVLAHLIGLMPEATLAAIVIVYTIGLIDPAAFEAILSVRRTEFVWAIAALLGVTPLTDPLGRERMQFNLARAVEKFQSRTATSAQ